MAATIAHIPTAPRRTTHTAAYRRNKVLKELGFWALLGVFLIFAAFPVYWMFITAFKQVNDLYNLQNNPFVFNLAPTLDQVRYLFEHTPYAQWLRNTLEVGLLMGFFKNVPREITEAARVDGCSRLGAMFRIVLPVSVPGILTVGIFAFTLVMQEYVYALTFVSDSDEKMVTLGVVTDLVRGDVFFWGSLMAGALFIAIPVAIAYNFMMDTFVRGITGGALK